MFTIKSYLTNRDTKHHKQEIAEITNYIVRTSKTTNLEFISSLYIFKEILRLENMMNE